MFLPLRNFVHILFTALFLCTIATESQARRVPLRTGPPANVLHFERAAKLSVRPSTPGHTRGSLDASFNAFGRRFRLTLEPHTVVAPGAQNLWVGDGGTTAETPTSVFYRGEIVGEPGSWARVRVENGILDGMIYGSEAIYFVEPGPRFFAGSPAVDMVIYRLSDTVSDWEPGSCAADDTLVGPTAQQSAAKTNDYTTLRADLHKLAGSRLTRPGQSSAATKTGTASSSPPTEPASTLSRVQVGLVADYEYFLRHGAASASDMQNIANQVDGIYQAELGVTLQIVQTVVHTTPDDPFSNTLDPFTLLNEFGNYKAKSSSPVHDTGIAHLFTGRDLDGSVIGIAWLGTVCHSRYGSGLSQDFSNINKSLVILAAHEIGHNHNAPHDNQSGSPCETTPSGYIMNPTISSQLNLAFSECSEQQIAPTVASASCFEPVPNDPPTCGYAISPSERSHSAASDTGSVDVTASVDCLWTAQSNVAWATISAGADGSGSGVTSYRMDANPNTTSRTGTLTIAGETFTLTQAGKAACIYDISPTSRSHGADSDTGSVAVTTAAECPWNAISNASWLWVTSGQSGDGNGTVQYAVTSNPNSEKRTGTLTIASQTLTVTQEGKSVCSYALSSTSDSHSADGGTGRVRVSTERNCAWTAVSNVAWLIVTKGEKGAGPGSMNYEVGKNTSTKARSGTLIIAEQTFLVSQEAGGSTPPPSCTYEISPTSRTHNERGGKGNVNVTTPDGCDWTTASNVSWIAITKREKGSGSGKVTYEVEANSKKTSRTGTLTIADLTFTVEQKGAR